MRTALIPNTEIEKQPSYPLEFVDLQVAFAQKVVELTKGTESETSLINAMQNYTNLPSLTNLGGEFSNQISPLASEDALPATIHSLHEANIMKKEPNLNRPEGSCIYATIEKQDEEDVIFMHFHNSMPGDISPFSEDEIKNRRKEVADAIKEALRTNPSITKVVTRSWLCNHKGYQTVYPDLWTQNMEVSITEGSLRRFDTWGQFLTKEGIVNQERMKEFLNAVNESTTTDELLNSFPKKPLYTECTVDDFINDPLFDEYFTEN